MAKDDDSSEREGISEAPEGAADLSLSTYAENEEVVTQFVDTPPAPPSWIVQLTPFDRRVMSTEHLLAELGRGRSVHADTLVWRGGMSEWQCIASIDLVQLSSPRGRPLTRGAGARDLASSRARMRLLALRRPSLGFGSAALLSSVALALYVLWVMSLFGSEAHDVSRPALQRQTAAEPR